MKNLRNNFLNRSLKNGGEAIDSGLLVKLKEKQDKCIFKPVRTLTRKMLQPTNFEKMKVGTAVKLFGNDIIAVLELLNASGDPEFLNVESTIEFMKIVRKWWEVKMHFNDDIRVYVSLYFIMALGLDK
jgi:hypothetical protein